MSMYLLQLSVVFILSIPFHQIVEIWSPLLSSSGNFGTLSPESNLTDFSEAFLTPRMAVEAPLCSGSKAPLCSGSQSCLGTSVSAEMDIFSFGLPSCQFHSETSLLSPQSLIAVFSLQQLLHLFGKQKSLVPSLAFQALRLPGTGLQEPLARELRYTTQPVLLCSF